MSLRVNDDSSDREIREAAERAVSSLPESPMQEGPPGKSAYQLAVEVEGFEGTVEEWLAYIHGRDGRTPQLRFEGTVIHYSYDGEEWHNGPDLRGPAPVKGVDYKDGEDSIVPGPRPEHRWHGTILSVQKADGSFDSGVDLKGDPSTVPGPSPDHRWSGTSLSVQKPDGSFGSSVDLKGNRGSDGIVPMYGADGKLWQGVISREYETVTDSNGQWRIDYSALGFTAIPRVHPISWYESTSASDQAITGGATKSANVATGRVVRGVSGSLLGVTSTWRFVPAGTPVTVTVTGPTK